VFVHEAVADPFLLNMYTPLHPLHVYDAVVGADNEDYLAGCELDEINMVKIVQQKIVAGQRQYLVWFVAFASSCSHGECRLP
jgi:hypothetical protein